MSSQPAAKPLKPSKSSNATSSGSFSAGSGRSSGVSFVSSHLAMAELKQRILASLSKLGDRDTYQIGVEDLEKIIIAITPETLPMLLNCLFDSSAADPKPAVKKESLRLLSFLCLSHRDLSAAYLAKIISHIVKRLKDADTGLRDACRDAIGSLSAQFLKRKDEGNGGGGAGPLVVLFAKPLFEAMAEQNKSLQSGAAVCMAKMVESAADPPVPAFQKLCPRICKLLNNPNYLTKASLLPVAGNLSQVGAIVPQCLEPLLQSIHECLGSADWVTRKAAADVLIALATHSSNLISDKTDSTITVLETCHFDKIKPVRDSMTEALNLFKEIAGKGEEGAPDKQKPSDQSMLEKNAETNSSTTEGTAQLAKASSDGSSNNSDSISKGKTGGIPEKAVLILKKKAPALTDKVLNPKFFQRLEKRGSGDLPIEVIVPHRNKNVSSSNNEDESETDILDSRGRADYSGRTFGGRPKQRYFGHFAREKWVDERVNGEALRMRASDHDQNEVNPRVASGNLSGFSMGDGQYEGSLTNSGGNWSSLQRQLLHLERQQAHIMNMLQDIMGGSHDGMITLENRVKCLERVVEEMARDLFVSSARRSNFAVGAEDSTGVRARATPWRSDGDEWDFPQYGASRNGQVGSRRARGSGLEDNRLTKSEAPTEHPGSSRRAWDKGARPVRLGEGPSARSVWQASKDEATLEAIRVAGEDNRTSRVKRVLIPEAEAMEDDNSGLGRDPISTSWGNAMHALRVGGTDSAYAEVLSIEDEHLLVKLMEKSGPVVDQLSNDIGNVTLHAIGQFLLDQNLFDICLSWIQQLLELVVENGPDVLGTPMELKKELLLNLYEASSTTDPPEGWEGPAPDQLLVQLASNWGIQLQHLDK